MALEIPKILYPCDLTVHSSKIIHYVLSLAEKYSSEVLLLHVVQDLREWAGLYMPHKHLELEQKEVVESARKYMARFCDDSLGGCPNFRMHVVSGNPAAEIVRFAKEESVGLIVMGTHGRKGLEFSLFGSVAAKVVRYSPIPVLTVNPDFLDAGEAPQAAKSHGDIR
jgi:nucleotide-binding universal stress UspA family protein